MEVCPVCRGEGFLPTFRPLEGGPPRLPLLGLWDPAELWDECPACEGTGRVPGEPLAHPDPWEQALEGRTEEEAQELGEWVAAYRRLRREARLAPEEAARGADLEVFGPLLF
ncbi:hypothetical protein [Thermus caldilimi]|uniref:hypothetical protein n=1 Tax=Thermus caldilimi TaxID=2483360 RepID=UPI0010766239|nr:hypothetical protein [Thermus caldilimi]